MHVGLNPPPSHHRHHTSTYYLPTHSSSSFLSHTSSSTLSPTHSSPRATILNPLILPLHCLIHCACDLQRQSATPTRVRPPA
ncbi:hypothetical protein BU24DRAFT_422549 [Aaosphaeria arxii CBS 175.79]|uniref:Uncharacterized protein n=1 Tax=Aaosphaeria arxii CBS 175.79 TaxID=1450172 RepID=A0A6A5XTQ6_9PLEO|nr:uncharacterized protein BU24DRAFT_422549 [Aaosphaeria arxii CBS 175.79]KAF2016197.1 hypothetical protein BU24DRAFT_422549 [Aaosphaeria arxii CBS 175.79]